MDVLYITDMLKNNLENNGQNKPDLSNKIARRAPSEGLFMSVSKKAEKITTAIYMVTDLISDTDPMRARIRQVSLSILSDTRSLSYLLTGDLHFHLAKIISVSWELVSLIDISSSVGFISDMNHRILKKAIIEFISDLRNRQNLEGFQNIRDLKFGEGQAVNIGLRSDFFDIDNQDTEDMTEEVSYRYPEDMFRQKGSDVEGQKMDKKDAPKMINKVSPKKVVSKRQSSEPLKMTERKDKILSLIKDKKDISISDIVSHFKEYSQKTIQRDLISLVAEGLVKRTGEKRWSRYSIL